jgi:hypothetical protein
MSKLKVSKHQFCILSALSAAEAAARYSRSSVDM